MLPYRNGTMVKYVVATVIWLLPAMAKSQPATLTGATLQFHTTSDDKDWTARLSRRL